MPSPFVPTPVFPFVPPLPGVPPLNLDPTAIFNLPTIALTNAVGLGAFGSRSRWGIFKDGSPALIADSVQGVEYSRDYRISDYPQTQGAFESYNKVQAPYQAKVTFLVGNNRVNFLNQAESIAKALDLFSIVTPEVTYVSANITHFSYRRVATHGVSLLQVEMWAQEVRIVNTGGLTGQSPNSANTQQNGDVQPVDAATSSSGANVTPPNLVTGTSNPDLTRAGLGDSTSVDINGRLINTTAANNLSNTQLNSTFSQEFGTRVVTEPLGAGVVTVPPGLPIATPDVAHSLDGGTVVVPIPGGVTPPT